MRKKKGGVHRNVRQILNGYRDTVVRVYKYKSIQNVSKFSLEQATKGRGIALLFL